MTCGPSAVPVTDSGGVFQSQALHTCSSRGIELHSSSRQAALIEAWRVTKASTSLIALTAAGRAPAALLQAGPARLLAAAPDCTKSAAKIAHSALTRAGG